MSRREGIDYAWGGPANTSALKGAGRDFVCRYLSTSDHTKNLSSREVAVFTDAKVDIVVVWENTAGRALQGRTVGASDAHNALAQARSLGMPDDRPIYFAVDFDVTSQFAQIAEYFKGVNSVLGVDRTGVYGEAAVCDYLERNNFVDWVWQTYAWSGGIWDSPASIQQYSNGHSLAGVSCDYDRSITTDFGQWRKGFSPAFLPKHRYATRDLKIGDRGTDVQRLQDYVNHRLIGRGYQDRVVEEDGYYGPSTEKAKHLAEYALGFPKGTVRREGCSRRSQRIIRHPEYRKQWKLLSYYVREKLRKKGKK